MKKMITLLLTVTMCVAILTGCGEEEKVNNTGTPATSKPEVATTPKPDTPKPDVATPTPEATTSEVTTSEDTDIPSGEKLETTLWSLTYDPNIWTYEEDDLYNDETQSDIVLTIPDGEDSYLISAEISVILDDPYSFREDLTYYGFDQYEYEVNNAYEFTNIGGVDCLKQEGEYWGEPYLRYFNRVENAGANVFIEIYGNCEDERVDQLLSGLSINLEDIGNEDGPWYWEGEPFSAQSSSAMVGTHTINSQWLPIEELIMTNETFEHTVAVSGDTVYLLVDSALKQYAFDGEKLTYEMDIPFDNEFTNIQAATDGTIWISGFMEPLIAWKDGTQTASYEGPDKVNMHPSGTWGINWFSSPDCAKISISNGVLTSTPMTFSEVDTISNVNVDNNYIFVSGSAVDESGHKVFVYDSNGNYLMTLCDANGEGLGSITFMAETTNGFLGLDGNMRDVILWTQDGTYIGAVDDGDLFGTNYPWFCGGTKLDDGSILVVMTEDRADQSAMELVAFQLTGF